MALHLRCMAGNAIERGRESPCASKGIESESGWASDALQSAAFQAYAKMCRGGGGPSFSEAHPVAFVREGGQVRPTSETSSSLSRSFAS